MTRAVIVSSLARSMLTSSRRSTLPDMSGTSPHLASITLRLASGWAKRKSAPRAICSPPPKQMPWTAAMTGTGRVRQRKATSWARFAILPWGRSSNREAFKGFDITDLISSPAQKALPSPLRTTARTPGMLCSCRAASRIEVNMSMSSAFNLSGRFKHTVATPAESVETRTQPLEPLVLISLAPTSCATVDAHRPQQNPLRSP
mmetsp:Transcript_31716/g.92143  ORF Transcript_31716/g.92143 Transcript_31716/m.92143 type:complete len:203 (-) Transcript_31716:48-656(-)